mgnify:CR=1 FL=1
MNQKVPKVNSSVLEVIAEQEQIITRQNALIARLVNENVEQEGIIAELMKNHLDDEQLSR